MRGTGETGENITQNKEFKMAETIRRPEITPKNANNSSYHQIPAKKFPLKRTPIQHIIMVCPYTPTVMQNTKNNTSLRMPPNITQYGDSRGNPYSPIFCRFTPVIPINTNKKSESSNENYFQ